MSATDRDDSLPHDEHDDPRHAGEHSDAPADDEEARRRRRSLAYCRMWAAPLDGLAAAATRALTAADVSLRDPDEVARRVLAATLVGLKAEGLTAREAFAFADAYRAWGGLAAGEEQYVLDPEPAAIEHRRAIGRFEAAWVLMWAMGVVRYLDFPDRACDPGRVAELTITRVAVGGADSLRPLAEILDTADVHVRLAAGLSDGALARLDATVVAERVRALSWLLRSERARVGAADEEPPA